MAKVLVVVILVLSILFVGAATTAISMQTKWKAEHDKVQGQLQKTSGELKNASARVKEVQDEKTLALQTKDGELAKLGEELSTTRGALDLEKSKSLDNEATLKRLEGWYGELVTETQRVNKINEELGTQLKTAVVDRDQALKEKDAAIRERNKLKDDRDTLDRKLKDTAGELGRVSSELRRYKEVYPALREAKVQMKQLDGRVVAVGKEGATAVISLGQDDGVEEGDRFSVRRGGTYVGDVEVTRTLVDQCAARLMSSMAVRGQRIQVGDLVTTRFVVE